MHQLATKNSNPRHDCSLQHLQESQGRAANHRITPPRESGNTHSLTFPRSAETFRNQVTLALRSSPYLGSLENEASSPQPLAFSSLEPGRPRETSAQTGVAHGYPSLVTLRFARSRVQFKFRPFTACCALHSTVTIIF